MLGRSKKTKGGKAVSPYGAVEGKRATFFSRATISDEKAIIGEQIAIEGSIRGAEDLEIAGSMKGIIELERHNFRVGPGGRVEGEIKARNVSVSGEFKGNIKSHENVDITREADVYGEIKAKSISIEDGAYVKGVIELDREPNRKSTGDRKPGAATVPETGQAPGAPVPADKKEM